jgi:hypothetical protein
VGLEWNPFSLVSTTEELLGRKSSEDRAVSAGKNIFPIMMALISCSVPSMILHSFLL